MALSYGFFSVYMLPCCAHYLQKHFTLFGTESCRLLFSKSCRGVSCVQHVLKLVLPPQLFQLLLRFTPLGTEWKAWVVGGVLSQVSLYSFSSILAPFHLILQNQQNGFPKLVNLLIAISIKVHFWYTEHLKDLLYVNSLTYYFISRPASCL